MKSGIKDVAVIVNLQSIFYTLNKEIWISMIVFHRRNAKRKINKYLTFKFGLILPFLRKFWNFAFLKISMNLLEFQKGSEAAWNIFLKG